MTADIESYNRWRGWVLTGVMFVMYSFSIGLSKCFSVFYLDLIDKYDASVAATGWILGAQNLIRFGLGPVASLLVKRFSVRTVMVSGGALVFIGYSLCGQINNIVWMYITYAVLAGVGTSFVYGPAIVLLGYYFEHRWKAIALGIAFSGVGFGTSVLPLVYTFLQQYFGFEGTMMILGACAFNMVPLALLCVEPVKPSNLCGQIVQPAQLEQGDKQQLQKQQQLSSVGSVNQTEKLLSSLEDLKQPESQTAILGTRKQTLPKVNFGQTGTQIEKQLLLEKDGNLDVVSLENQKNLQKLNQETITSSMNGNIKENQEKYTATFNDEKVSQEKVVFIANSGSEKTQIEPSIKPRNKSRVFDWAILKNFHVVSVFFFAWAYCTCTSSSFAYWGGLITQNGHQTERIGVLLSICGIGDVVGNIILGLLFEIPFIRRSSTTYFFLLGLILAILMIVMPLLTDFLAFCITFALWGILATINSTKNVVLYDNVSSALLPDAIGLSLLGMALGYGLGPLVTGSIVQAFGDYALPFYTTGALFAVVNITALCLNFIFIQKQQKKT